MGLTVISAFEDVGSGQQKVLRYRKDASARHSGGFLLEIFQEDCEPLSPWVRQDTNSQDQQHYNISPYYNINIGTSNVSSSANTVQKNCRYPGPYDHTNRSRGSCISKQEETSYLSSAAYKSNVPSAGAGDRLGRLYSHSHNNSVAHESNTSATDNGKNKVQQNTPQDNRSALNTKNDTDKHQAIDILQEYNNTMNNSDKQMYKFDFINKEDNSFADKSTFPPSVDTAVHFSNNANKQEHSNDDDGVSRSNTDQSQGCTNCSQTASNRERRTVAADRLWSIRDTTCRAWGFAQWLMQVKHHFWSHAPQLLCPAPRCQEFNEVSGWIQSPGYPQAYPNNLNCCYR
jgi:hypothetical protein